MKSRFCLAVLGALLLTVPVRAADLTAGFKKGTPDIKSMGAMTFGPEGILFVGDTAGAAIFAIDTGDNKASTETGAPKVPNVNEKIASLLGVESKQLRINDLAVNLVSGNTYLTVMRGTTPNSPSVLLRVDRKGKIEEVGLKDVKFDKVSIPNANEKNRTESITGLAYVQGKLYVAGLSNEEFASNLRSIPFPFKDADKGTSVEIYHGAHGAFETRSPVRTFVAFDIKGETNIMAAYTCTPLVRFPVGDLKAGQKVRGTTIAELGNGNKPLDMVVYEKDGKQYILIANSRRGVMKVTTEGIDKIEGITKKVSGTAGLKYETVEALKGVEQLAKFDAKHTLVLTNDKGTMNLETVALP